MVKAISSKKISLMSTSRNEMKVMSLIAAPVLFVNEYDRVMSVASSEIDEAKP